MWKQRIGERLLLYLPLPASPKNQLSNHRRLLSRTHPPPPSPPPPPPLGLGRARTQAFQTCTGSSSGCEKQQRESGCEKQSVERNIFDDKNSLTQPSFLQCHFLRWVIMINIWPLSKHLWLYSISIMIHDITKKMVKIFQYKIMVNVNIKIMGNIKILNWLCRPAIGGELTPGLVNYMTRFLFLPDKPDNQISLWICFWLSKVWLTNSINMNTNTAVYFSLSTTISCSTSHHPETLQSAHLDYTMNNTMVLSPSEPTF